MSWTPDHPERVTPRSVTGWGRAPLPAPSRPVEGWRPLALKYRAALALAGDGQLTVGTAQLYARALALAGGGGLEVVTDGGNRPPLDGLTIWTKLGFSTAMLLTGDGTLSMLTTAKPTVAIPFAGSGALAIATNVPTFRAMALGSAGALTVATSFPVFSPVTTLVTVAGAFNYTIPWWCKKIDVVLVGGGAGATGGVGAFVDGVEGHAGKWIGQTLVRGVDFPASATTIAGVVGAPGNGGPGAVANTGQVYGTNGGATTCTTVGLSAPGGGAAASLGDLQGTGGSFGLGRDGEAAGTFVFNSITYTGGAKQTTKGGSGNPPGGGGKGGAGGLVSGNNGGAGSRGQAWFRAYQ